MRETFDYYIYSAMTQAVGALLALVGVFIVYRLQIQRERISLAREHLREKVCPGRICSITDVVKDAEKSIQNLNSNNGTRQTMKLIYDGLIRHLEIWKFTIIKGKFVVRILAELFTCYVILLFLNSSIYQIAKLRIFALFFAFILTSLVIINITYYISKSIHFGSPDSNPPIDTTNSSKLCSLYEEC